MKSQGRKLVYVLKLTSPNMELFYVGQTRLDVNSLLQFPKFFGFPRVFRHITRFGDVRNKSGVNKYLTAMGLDSSGFKCDEVHVIDTNDAVEYQWDLAHSLLAFGMIVINGHILKNPQDVRCCRK